MWFLQILWLRVLQHLLLFLLLFLLGLRVEHICAVANSHQKVQICLFMLYLIPFLLFLLRLPHLLVVLNLLLHEVRVENVVVLVAAHHHFLVRLQVLKPRLILLLRYKLAQLLFIHVRDQLLEHVRVIDGHFLKEKGKLVDGDGDHLIVRACNHDVL